MSTRRPLLTLGSMALALAFSSAAPVRAGELHEVTPAPAKTTVGTPGKSSVTLAAKNGWKLNADAPISLKLVPAAGLTVDKAKFSRADLALSTKEQARFDVAFQASAAGPSSIACEASFVICQESACKPIKETVTLNVDVAPAKKK